MGRNITIDARRGAGAPHEILFGQVYIERTMLVNDGSKIVFPDATTVGIDNGVAVFENAEPSPAGPEPAWAYRVTFRNSQTGRSWYEIVGIPEGSTPRTYASLPRFTTTVPPGVTGAQLQNWVAETEVSKIEAQAARDAAVAAASEAVAPTDTTVSTLIGTPGSATATTLSAAIEQFVEPQAILPSATNVAIYGESTTESVGTNWPVNHLAPYTGLTVANRGASGQGAADILLRAGAFKPRVTLVGNSIPASGPVVVTSIDPVTGWRVGGSGEFAFTGFLAGVKGQLVHNMVANTWVFKRATPGDVVAVSPGAPFTRDPSLTNPLDRLIVWTGRNNVTDGSLPTSAGLVSLAPSAQATAVKDVIVLGVINGTTEGTGTTNHTNIVKYNNQLAALYGERFLDIRRAFIDHGLTRAGITPTIQDTANIAADRPPTSLMTDSIHPNAIGYEIIARLVSEKLLAVGWVSSITIPEDPSVEPAVMITSDSFNRADTASGVLGTSDAANGGTAKAWTSDAQLQVLSNQVGATTVSATRYASVDLGQVDHYVEILLTGEIAEGGVFVRSTDNSNNYSARVSSGGTVALDARVAGSTIPLEQSAAGAIALGDRLGLEAKGSRIRVFKNGAVLLERAEDARLTTGTRAGLRSAFSNATFRLDDFKAYDKKPA